jgi:signal transduction histidine kinase
MDGMRILLKLVWKSLAKLLKRLGLGVFLVPVAALGMAMFGVQLWTVAAVAFALALTLWRPAAAALLLPVTMVAAGITGLIDAAGSGAFGVMVSKAVPWRVFVPFRPKAMQRALPEDVVLRQKLAKGPAAGAQAFAGPPSGRVVVQGGHISGPARASSSLMRSLASPKGSLLYLGVKPGGQPPRVIRRHAGFDLHIVFGVWGGRLLVPLALLLLTVGLLLMPRTFAALRTRVPGLLPYLRQRMREHPYAVALVPVALLGLTVFGVRPWTVVAVIVAVIVAFCWPNAAADLLPAALGLFAVRGFGTAASWQSMSFAGSGSPVQYGAVFVDSRQTALLAGAEASVFLALAAWLVPRTIIAHARGMVNPDPDLAGRVQRLTESRGHAIDAASSELRRIERDLHDGAQARLVALGMNLRAVERMLPMSPEAALALVAEARETSLRALNDLRDLIRGIYPPVLADRGLGPAVRALALDTPMPVDLDISLRGRLSPPVEAACYFAVAEALANAVKHSGARRVHIRVAHADGVLRIEVSDDGAGGADLQHGSGLRGVERRLSTFDGIMAVSSPPGGPTMIVMEVPCELSSPKICSY